MKSDSEKSRSADSAPAALDAFEVVLRYEVDANRPLYFNNITGTLSLTLSESSYKSFKLRDYVRYIVHYTVIDAYSSPIWYLSSALIAYERQPFETEIFGVKHDGRTELIISRRTKPDDGE